MEYNYLEAVKADVRDYISENDIRVESDPAGFIDAKERLRESLYDELWTEDSVTGNGSGTYTFSRNRAKWLVFSDFDTVANAASEFCDPAEIGRRFLMEDWEFFDVIARLYVLRQAIDEELDVMPTWQYIKLIRG